MTQASNMDKGYSEMTGAQVAGYVGVTLAYMVFIAVMMLKVSPWWFLGLILWNWKWNSEPTS